MTGHGGRLPGRGRPEIGTPGMTTVGVDIGGTCLLPEEPISLVWDRLPLSALFPTIFAVVVADRLSEAAGRKQYVQFLDKGVVGVDAKTGQFLWRYDGTSKGPANIATPVARDGYVYSTNARRFGGALIQLHAAGERVTAERIMECGFAQGNSEYARWRAKAAPCRVSSDGAAGCCAGSFRGDGRPAVF